jgi:hypothetical protein
VEPNTIILLFILKSQPALYVTYIIYFIFKEISKVWLHLFKGGNKIEMLFHVQIKCTIIQDADKKSNESYFK